MMQSLFEAPPISVGELCRQIRRALGVQFPRRVRVLGEISKCQVIDGIAYFSLKDAQGLIDCICFRSTVQELGIKLPVEDGAAVEVDGFVDIYEFRSKYQIRVSNIVPVGLGALHLQFERLKEKLQREGLFERSRKRPIPKFLRAVAIVTSENAAALQDFVTTCRRRGAHIRISVVPAPVQGAAAAPALARAITAAGLLPVDVVVVARGGGSIEDLWAFNTEVVARAIAACAIPVISAVGHETDHTIADFVADLRAPTPTAAAEFVAQERNALLERIAGCEFRMRRALLRQAAGPRIALARTLRDLRRISLGMLERKSQRLDDHGQHLQRTDPRRRIRAWRERASAARRRLPVIGMRMVVRKMSEATAAQTSMSVRFAALAAQRRRTMDVVYAKLQALGPRQTLERGYAIAYGAQGQVLTDSAATKIGEKIAVELKAGWLSAIVREKKENHEDDGAKD